MFKRLWCTCFTGTRTKDSEEVQEITKVTEVQQIIKVKEQLSPDEVMMVLYLFAYVAMVFRMMKL